MSQRQRLTWTKFAQLTWSDELAPEFRDAVQRILKGPISDTAFRALARVVERYSALLAHEIQAAPLRDQLAAMKATLKGAERLVVLIERLDTSELGSLLEDLLPEIWEETYRRNAKFEHSLHVMAEDLGKAQIGASGAHRKPEGRGGPELLSRWQAADLITRPAPVMELRLLLWELRNSLTAAQARLSQQTLRSTRRGDSFDRLVGFVLDWAEKHAIKVGATKQDAYNDYGSLVYLVKVILEQIPELIDPTGKPLAATRQIRRKPVADATLADQVVDARKAHKERRGLGPSQ